VHRVSREQWELLGRGVPAVYEPVWVPAAFRGHYRHMAKRDAATWEQFLGMMADRFEAFAYDVALGGVVVDMPEMDEATQRGYQYSTALRVDVCAKEGERFWIIEVRPEATVSALGAALCYTMVAQREQLFPGELVPAVVCSYMQPDVLWCCQQLNVQVFNVPSG